MSQLHYSLLPKPNYSTCLALVALSRELAWLDLKNCPAFSSKRCLWCLSFSWRFNLRAAHLLSQSGAWKWSGSVTLANCANLSSSVTVFRVLSCYGVANFSFESLLTQVLAADILMAKLAWKIKCGAMRDFEDRQFMQKVSSTLNLLNSFLIIIYYIPQVLTHIFIIKFFFITTKKERFAK